MREAVAVGAPVFYFEIMTKNAPELRSFYRNTFGWEIEDPKPGAKDVDYAFVTPRRNAGIEGGLGEAPDGYGGHVTIYISVPDVALALAHVELSGGTKIMGPEQVPDGPIVGLVEDPHGHTIGLVQVPASIV